MKAKHSLLFVMFLFFCFAACKKEKAGISVCAADKKAYRADSITWEVYTNQVQWQAVKFNEFGVEQALFRNVENETWSADIYDWDLSIMNSVNIRKNRTDWLDSYDYFLVYSEVPTTDSNQCCMKLELHRGRPYNKNSTSFADFTDCAHVGDYDSLSKTTIYDKGRACKVALNKAAQTAINSGLMK